MRTLKNNLTVGKNTKNTTRKKAKSFGYQILGFGSGGAGSVCEYIEATGGCVTTSGDFKIHKFTGPGTFCVTAGGGDKALTDYLVIAGGGGGGTCGGGGGGAGGFREGKTGNNGSWSATPLATCVGVQIEVGAFPITVGAGGSGGNPNSFTNVGATNGVNSVFSTITSAGGGVGATSLGGIATDGGSGGGGGGAYPPVGLPGGIEGDGNTPPVSPSQGNPGGRGMTSPSVRPSECGGGGGAGAAGQASNNGTSAGAGGSGLTSGIDNGSTGRAGGGGGGTFGPTNWGNSNPAGNATDGGAGGNIGRPQNQSHITAGGNGSANTGGGGGGAGRPYAQASAGGGDGGSGIVFIRYKFQD